MNRSGLVRSRAARAALALTLGTACLPLSGAGAQELSLQGFAGRSERLDLHDPMGVRVVAAAYPLHVLGVRLSYARAHAAGRYDGQTCDIGWPVFSGCLAEAIATRADLSTLGYGLTLRTPWLGAWRATASWERVHTRVASLDRRGVRTGRTDWGYLGPDITEGGVLERLKYPNGWAARAGLRRADFLLPGVALEVGGGVQHFRSDDFATDVALPFLGDTRIRELYVGLVVGR